MRFKSLTEAIDTETPTGRAMWQMIGMLAELDRSLIRERTKAGRDAAKKRGVKFGRKPELSPQQVTHARKLIESGESPAHVAKLLNVARSTLYTPYFFLSYFLFMRIPGPNSSDIFSAISFSEKFTND